MKETKKDRVRSFKVYRRLQHSFSYINSLSETWRAPLMGYQKATPNNKEIQ